MPTSTHATNALSLIENDTTKILGLTIGKHQNIQPGQYVPRADAQDPPKIFFPGLSPSKTYLCVNLDIDGPFPSWTFLGPILHWVQPGYKPKPKPKLNAPDSDSDSESSTLYTAAPFIADYIGPAPPPGSAPHRYLFFLYEEPEGLDPSLHAPAEGKKMGNWPRMRYDFDAWAEEVGLGPVVAFNYFTSN